MTRDEIERRIIDAGGSAALWEYLYLRVEEIAELLGVVTAKAAHPFIHSMFAIAAYTDARRSEILSSKREDIDLAGGTIVIREKKRVRGQNSTRRVLLSDDAEGRDHFDLGLSSPSHPYRCTSA
jgi:integrase